ncbi:hypothetical protein [Methanobrevibacter sp.]|uniref:hypothetical protein n=1 Tax=Methanobrevibacter sp. TaxID=66852 RepID=UPI003890498B
MHFGFSYIAVIFLIMLFVPNIIWTGNKPSNYEKYAENESKILSVIERIGQVLVVCSSLFFTDENIGLSLWLILAFLFMILYEIYWIRYFRSPKRMQDMYSNFLGIPVAGATLPVLGFLFLGIHEQNILLIVSSLILAVGHVGIHLSYQKNLN